MKVWLVLIIAATLAAFLLLRSESHDAPPVSRPEHASAPQSDLGDQEPTRREAALTDEAPRLASRPVRVVIDTGPRRPGEMLVTYKHRVDLARRFDEFVRRSGVTEEQARLLLLAMYDRQRNNAAILEELRRDHTIPTEDLVPLARARVEETHEVFQRILTREQYELWWEICGVQCIGYLNGPVLRLEGDEER